MTDPFADPGSSTAVDFNDLAGALLLVTVSGIEEHVPTVHTKPGEKTPAIRADIDVLDGAHANEKYADALIFPKMLQSQLRSRVGQKVLGRLGRGVAKPGQSAPWQLDAATDADKQVGRQFLSGQLSSAPQPSAAGEPPF